MPEISDAQVVELFHLAFLQVLQARVDQARYVLKGGANLRFFFDSMRYSEDPEITELYDTPATWEQMRLFVARLLLGGE